MDSLYVCLFSNGCVKVGRSKNADRRIAQHAVQLSCFRIDLIGSAVFECCGAMQVAESRALRKCREVAAETRGDEWFYGIDFDLACEIAKHAASGTDHHERYSGASALVRAIDVMGGMTNLAKAIGGNTKSQTIANWIKRGVPAERCVMIEKITGVRCEELKAEFNWALVIEVLSGSARHTEPNSLQG